MSRALNYPLLVFGVALLLYCIVGVFFDPRGNLGGAVLGLTCATADPNCCHLVLHDRKRRWYRNQGCQLPRKLGPLGPLS
jgi:hypothetical protein